MLTTRQKQVLDFIRGRLIKKGVAPTHAEIAKHLGLSSVATVHEHVATLQAKGYVERQKGRARAMRAIHSEQFVHIPLVGTVAAGRPIEAIETKETIAIPKNRALGMDSLFALKVAGDSMIDEGINDGDTVLVRRQQTARNGEKVVALLDNQDATLKTFYKEGDRIRLQPANKKMDPIYVDEYTTCTIQGVVVDVITSPKPVERQSRTFLASEANRRTPPPRKHLNSVHLGDIVELLADLPDESIDMVFADPDYNVGIKYNNRTYTRDFDEYITWYAALAQEALRVLKRDGNAFFINYPKQNAHLRVRFLDKEFPHTSEYVWVYNTNVGHTPQRFTTAHRSILHVRKSNKNKFYKDAVALPYKNPTDKRIRENIKNGSLGRMPYSWLEYNLVKNVSREKTYHACQIPQKLTEILVKASTRPDDVVLVLFGGSGAELEICKKLKRNFMSAEIDPKYHQLINDRLSKGFIEEKYKLRRKGRV